MAHLHTDIERFDVHGEVWEMVIKSATSSCPISNFKLQIANCGARTSITPTLEFHFLLSHPQNAAQLIRLRSGRLIRGYSDQSKTALPNSPERERIEIRVLRWTKPGLKES